MAMFEVKVLFKFPATTSKPGPAKSRAKVGSGRLQSLVQGSPVTAKIGRASGRGLGNARQIATMNNPERHLE
ncbi:hypothetical protein BOTBODRAFT_28298 [Botryobasidium botryosum FD-172 SS1]|uniref:Uncharacterized protein n=1 Tax=Botryobasidium botryosum (strain FD-172 SS1) TaxID=930990 RepID=A0A067N4W5_BOTB1|nr:hypothetical protein BOTBODRAFT_28298 [Botryobasidium botryosum FD-172 SS1]